MIIHYRAHLNSVQNAVGYMIKPTVAMMFSAPSTADFDGVFSAEEIREVYSAKKLESEYGAVEIPGQYTAKTDEE